MATFRRSADPGWSAGCREASDLHREFGLRGLHLTRVLAVQQAGLFGCNNIPEQQLDQVLRAFCPNILFPYLRETVDSLVVRGGLPALQLSPVNFDALYQQVRAQQDAKGKEAQH